MLRSRPDAQGKNALVREDPGPPLRLVIMGGPGCGKGSLSRAIVEKFGVVHVSVGDILRSREGDGSELGQQVADYVSSGRLVPDELAIDIVKQTLDNEECKTKGWLLDNFPRTADQAMAMLDLRIIPSKYIHIEVPDHVLEERCMGRLTDPVTGHIYHSKFNPPPDDPELRERLVHRADDNEEAVKRRLEIYQDNIDGVLEFIDDLRQEFDGQRPVEDLSREIITYIKPDAPLYALQSTLPAIRGADAVKEAFTKREEEHQEPPQPAEGEEAEAAPPTDDDAPPSLKGREFREDIAKSIIDLALGKMFDERQEERRMRRLAFKFTAQHAIRTLDALVEVHFASHDAGDAYEEASWDAGTEPSSGAMDSWGRGVVPIRRKAKPLTLENVDRGSDASRAGSARSVRSARSGRTFRGEGGAVPKPPAKKKAPAKKEEEKREAAQVELTPEERLRLSLKAKLDEEGAKRKKEKEYAAEVLKFEKMAKSMASRGQNFTFDQKGEVIMVNELPGDKLPTPTVFTKAMPMGSQSGQADRPFVQRMAEGLTLDPSKIFTPSDTVQPPAAESHSLASGVTLKEGTVTKQGIPRDKDPLRMSRKDYTLLAEEEALMMGGTMRKAQEDQGVTEGTMAGMTMNDDGMFGAKPTQAMSAADTGGGDAASVTGTHVTGGGATADAGSSLEDAGGVGGMTAAMAAAAGGMAEVPAGGEGLAQAVQVYDWDRSDWKVEGGGIVEDALAIRKPDPTTMLQSVGPRVKNPRARHQYPEVVQSKEKLPPPIFPGVHGHGVVTSYLGADNQFKDTLGGSLSPLKNQDSSQNLGDSSLNNSRSRVFEAQPPGQKRVTDYKRNFPKGPASTLQAANPKLLRELQRDAERN